MLLLYALLILTGSIPLAITLKRIRTYHLVKRLGVNTYATVTHIQTHRLYKAGMYDRLTLAYTKLETGVSVSAQTATVHKKYKVGDRVGIAYERNKSAIYIPADVKGYRPALWFAILLIVFVLFAVYKINEMVQMGN